MHYLLSERGLFGLFFVNLDSQPRGLRRKPITILGVEVTSNDIPTPRYIRQHIFLDQKIWRGESEMECHCIRDWAQGVMRGDSHLVCLCHGCNFFCFHDASAMTKVRLDDMAGSPFENGPELMASHEPLSRGNGNLHRLSHFQERLHVFGRDGLFAKVG